MAFWNIKFGKKKYKFVYTCMYVCLDVNGVRK